jgi:V/A-type H+-transporting ATPase subunit C
MKFLRFLSEEPSNYGYLNARLRSRMMDFLPREKFLKLSSGRIDELELFLMDSTYGESYRKGLLRQNLSLNRRIEMALAHTATRRLKEAKSFAEGEPGDFFEILLSRADIYNCRYILRACRTETFGSAEEPFWHGYGTLPGTFFEDLWASRDVDEIIEKALFYGHPFAVHLAHACRELKNSGQLVFAERRLLGEILQHCFGILKAHRGKNADIVREYLGRMVDIWNVNIFSRRKRDEGEGIEFDKPFLEGGTWLSVQRLSEARNLRELLFETPWQGAVGHVSGERVQVPLQSVMSTSFAIWQMKLYRHDPLGIEVAISYVARQLTEWQNMNILAAGLELGFESQEIVSRLTFPEEQQKP